MRIAVKRCKCGRNIYGNTDEIECEECRTQECPTCCGFCGPEGTLICQTCNGRGRVPRESNDAIFGWKVGRGAKIHIAMTVERPTEQPKPKATFTDFELLYSATAHCKCGEGLAYPLDHDEAMKASAWVCAKVLRGESSPAEHDAFPFAFYKVREETSINNRTKQTTRPPGTICLTVGHATCKACDHKWDSEPYEAPGLSHHWRPGACPNCGNDCAAHGTWSSEDKRPPIESRYSDIVLKA